MSHSRTCWLCEFNREEEAVRLLRFLSDNAALMSTDQLAQAVHQRLEEIDPNGNGHSLAEVKEHILTHTLIPSIKISGVLRSLLLLLDRLDSTLMMTSDEDGTTVIDAKNVAVYLKVVNEIMQIYKTGDTTKLMFADYNASTK